MSSAFLTFNFYVIWRRFYGSTFILFSQIVFGSSAHLFCAKIFRNQIHMTFLSSQRTTFHFSSTLIAKFMALFSYNFLMTTAKGARKVFSRVAFFPLKVFLLARRRRKVGNVLTRLENL